MVSFNQTFKRIPNLLTAILTPCCYSCSCSGSHLFQHNCIASNDHYRGGSHGRQSLVFITYSCRQPAEVSIVLGVECGLSTNLPLNSRAAATAGSKLWRASADSVNNPTELYCRLLRFRISVSQKKISAARLPSLPLQPGVRHSGI